MLPVVAPNAWPVPPDKVALDPAGNDFGTVATFPTVPDEVEKKLNETFAVIGEFTVPVPLLAVKVTLTGATEIKFLNVNAKLLNEVKELSHIVVFAYATFTLDVAEVK
jgi:hypothetical protein